MNNKRSNLLAVIILLTVAALFVTGCGKSGSRFENLPPEISITSYEGWTEEFVPATVDTTTDNYSFQQKIFWHATDPDGIITGFAFRILDENMEPIPTPRYEYLSSVEDGLIPDVILQSETLLGNSREGWAYHYLPSADESIPLDDATADRTIWTTQKYAVINFPAADTLGNPANLICHFEVIAIDNRGDIVTKSAWRRFRTDSPRPTCLMDTTKGNPDGKDVGSGIKLKFTMHDSDALMTEHVPYKFEFRMMKINAAGETVAGSMTDWIDTHDSDRIDQYLLTGFTDPPLEYDYTEDGVDLGTITKVEGRATDLAGVMSEPAPDDSTYFITFKVKPGFSPRTLLYHKKIIALGNNHFDDYNSDEYNVDAAPVSLSGGRTRYGTSLFMENVIPEDDTLATAVYSVVHSPNLKIWLRWGWWGEYMNDLTGEYPTHEDFTNSSFPKKVDVVLSDNSTSMNPVNYYSEITHYDIRYDNAPFVFAPFPGSEYNYRDDDGTEWLRLPVSSPLNQSIVLTTDQVEPGLHKFEVRCVDMQGISSKNPAVIDFVVRAQIDPANRNGVLIIDDDENNVDLSPDQAVDDLYMEMARGLGLNDAEIDVVKYSPNGNGSLPMDYRKRKLALGLLQKYRMVIYHSDNPGKSGNLNLENDGLSLFMQNGGNLVISYTHLVKSQLEAISKRTFKPATGTEPSLIKALGLPNIPKLEEFVNPAAHVYFQKAIGNTQLGYPDVNLRYEKDDPSEWISPLVQGFQGFSNVAYFVEEDGVPLHNGENIYTIGAKPVDWPLYPPTQELYDFYNGRTIGIRHINGATNNMARAYLFTFPLSYMEIDDSKALISKIWSELM